MITAIEDVAEPLSAHDPVAGVDDHFPLEPSHPCYMLMRLAEEAMAQRQYERAYEMFTAAARADAGSGRFTRKINRAMRAVVPRWHFRMMHDAERSRAYAQAIEQVVGPGQLVLDIGSGAGLLSMLAARAGADQVVACEAVGMVASGAREVVKANGYSDRITVVSSPSTDLRVGSELPRKADVLVTEIFDCALLGEFALPALRHARQELLSPEAVVLPRSGGLFAQLVESPELRSMNHIGEIEGFDFSPFTSLASLEYFSTNLGNYQHRVLTPPVELFRFDFGADTQPEQQIVEVVPQESGKAHAVVMWFELDLVPGITLTNNPETSGLHWKQAVQTFREPRECRSGEPLGLRATHDMESVLVNLC
ncbi:50S ribosomal protein L11 methyltransferase [Streptomyces sp. HC307]|uniref:50S ribosomal protein L11 methyltransferase n=1 Tax=Streptomyces flavusporus TaxID=3385496 RepID=UPI0039171BCB